MAYEGLQLAATRSKKFAAWRNKKGLVFRGGVLMTAEEAKGIDPTKAATPQASSKPAPAASDPLNPGADASRSRAAAAVARIISPGEARAEVRAAIAESQGLPAPARKAAALPALPRGTATPKRSAADAWALAQSHLGIIPRDQAPADNSAGAEAWTGALASTGMIPDAKRPPIAARGAISQRSADTWNRVLAREGFIDLKASGADKARDPWEIAIARVFPVTPAN